MVWSDRLRCLMPIHFGISRVNSWLVCWCRHILGQRRHGINKQNHSPLGLGLLHHFIKQLRGMSKIWVTACLNVSEPLPWENNILGCGLALSQPTPNFGPRHLLLSLV